MSVTELHNKAMELADLGDISKMKNLPEDALRYYSEAFELERCAAYEAKKTEIPEPSLSILLRSAASLGLWCKRFRESEQLIALALSGEPPFEIAEELRDILETVNFERHLKVKGVDLLEGQDVQLSISGNGVGYGLANEKDILSKVNVFSNLATRTIERKLNKPFRKNGQPSKNVKELSTIYLSAPRVASFAVTLKFATSPNDQQLPGLSSHGEIIEDIAKNIALIEEGKIEELVANFENQETYLDNFVALTRELAPDGENVSLFGITYKKNGEDIPIQLTRKRDTFGEFPTFDISTNEGEGMVEYPIKTVTGILSVANGLEGSVKISTDKSKNIIFSVSDSMSDIVKNYWYENVVVTYNERKAGKIGKTLISIDKV